CKVRLDLGFLIDGSGSIERQGRGNFGRVINFIKTIVSLLPVSPRQTRIGAVLFSSRPYLMFNFQKYRTVRQVLAALQRIRYPRGGTKTGRALRYTYSRLFRSRSRVRKQALIVLTDGKSQDSVGQPAAFIKNQGVELFAIGVGRNYRRRDLNQIASRGNVFTAKFENLGRIIGAIKSKVCRPQPITPKPVPPTVPTRPPGKLF
ncbi:predicted protein, partial [Nematostella vectensis]